MATTKTTLTLTAGDYILKTARSYKTFSDGSTCNRFMVDGDGRLLAYDPVAGHYTSCHSITPRQDRQIRREIIEWIIDNRDCRPQ